MKISLWTLLGLCGLVLISPLNAQETPAEETVTEEEEPATVTPEYKIQAQVPLMRDLKYTANNYRKEELRDLVRAIQQRERELLRKSDPNARYAPENVDVNDPDAMEAYLNRKLRGKIQ